MDAVRNVLTAISDAINSELSDSIIEELIKSAESHPNSPALSIPDGLTWFGVTRSLTENDLKGKIVVLDFFTYCCMNCVHVISQLKSLEHRYENSSVCIIGVHSPKFTNEKEEENLRNAIMRLGIAHPVVNDPDTILWERYDISCWPTLLIFGPNGKPIFSMVGEGQINKLHIFIDCALKYYTNQLSYTTLPLSSNLKAVADRLMSFPSSITGSECGTLAVACHHRVVVFSGAGIIQYIIGAVSPGFVNGNFECARFNDPHGIIFQGNDKIFVADSGNHAIRLIDLTSLTVSTVAGNGQQGNDLIGGRNGLDQALCSPWGLCLVSAPNFEITNFSNVAGCSPPTSKPNNTTNPPPPPPPLGLEGLKLTPPPPPPPPPPPSFAGGSLKSETTSSILDGRNTFSPQLNTSKLPFDVGSRKSCNTKSQPMNVLLIGMSGIHQIWGYFLEDTTWWKGRKYAKGVCAALAGTGEEGNRNNVYPGSANFAQPSGICYAKNLNCVFIADSESSSIRKLCLLTGQVSPIVGGHIAPDNLFSYGDVDGHATEAKLQHPLDVSWDEHNQQLYVVDTYNHKLKQVDVEKRQCTNVPLAITLNEPGGVFVHGFSVYISDTNNHALFNWNQTTNTENQVHLRRIKKREEWPAFVQVLPSGTDISLVVKVAETISGRWSIIGPCDAVIPHRNGCIDNGVMEIKLRINDSVMIQFDVDLTECRENACHMYFRRLVLKTLITNSAEADVHVILNPKL